MKQFVNLTINNATMAYYAYVIYRHGILTMFTWDEIFPIEQAMHPIGNQLVTSQQSCVSGTSYLKDDNVNC